MHKLLPVLVVVFSFAVTNSAFSADGLTKYQRAKLKASIRAASNPGLETRCDQIKTPDSKVLYKHPGSNHLPPGEQNTMTFIHSTTIQGPADGKIRVYDNLGNLVSILGRKFPNYVVGNQPRYYNIPTGDLKTAQKVATIIKNNTGQTGPAYLRVANRICYEVPDVTFSRYGF